MSNLARPNTGPLFVDPHNEQVRVVNMVSFHPNIGGLVDLALCTYRVVPDHEGGAKHEAIVAARLRFDLNMAKSLRDGLSQQIELAEMSKTQPN